MNTVSTKIHVSPKYVKTGLASMPKPQDPELVYTDWILSLRDDFCGGMKSADIF